MRRMRETQKQKLNLINFHRLAQGSLRRSSSRPHLRRLVRPRNILVGLTATIGISSLAFATHHETELHSQSIKADISSSSKSSGNSNQTSTTVSVDTTAPTQPADEKANTSSNNNAQVTINNQPVPLENGTVQRTFTSNGSTYSVDITIDSHSTSSSSNQNSTDISIDSNGSSASDNSVRGSPRR